MTKLARGAFLALLLASLGAPVGRAQEAATGAGEAAGAQEASIGAGEGALSILARPGYIERGATDPALDWVTGFEEATGCRVTVTTADSSEEIVALMEEGGFDLVTASGDVSLRLVAAGRVQPIDPGLIPSWDMIDLRLQGAPWHTVDGVHYGVPLIWGPNLLIYSTEAFAGLPPDSWEVVFEEMDLPDGGSNRGRVQAYGEAIHIADAALYLMHHRPELGIKSPYALDEAQYAAALEVLRRQRPLVGRYWRDAGLQVDDFKAGRVAASGSWPYQMGLLRAEGAPVDGTIPREGATGWAETTMLAAEAEHPACAYLWFEHQLASNLQSDLSARLGAVPAVPAACSDGRGRQTQEGCDAAGLAEFDRIRFWTTPVADCAQGEGACVPYARWARDYPDVTGQR